MHTYGECLLIHFTATIYYINCSFNQFNIFWNNLWSYETMELWQCTCTQFSEIVIYHSYEVVAWMDEKKRRKKKGKKNAKHLADFWLNSIEKLLLFRLYYVNCFAVIIRSLSSYLLHNVTDERSKPIRLHVSLEF